MTRHDFIGRWALHLSEEYREVFLTELALLLALEHARERRRLCTDAVLYEKACEETAEEIRRYVAGTPSSSAKATVKSHALQGTSRWARLRRMTYRAG